MKTPLSPPTVLDSRGRPMAFMAPGGYQGAAYSRARSYIYAPLTDSRKELNHWNRTELARKANYLRKNVGMIRGVAKSLVDHAIGSGIYAIPNTPDRAWNALAWDYFTEAAKIADVTGRMTLWELQRTRTLAKFFFGEMFTLLTKSASGWPQFQAIRSHLCGSYDVKEEDGWCDGVKLDGVSRARAYRFALKGDETYITVPSANVIHSFLIDDVDQVRGVTPLAHGINNLHDIMDTLSLEKGAVKELSRTSRVITTESGEDEDEPRSYFSEGQTDPSGDGLSTIPLEQVFGTEIARLKIGEKLEAFASARPSPTFVGFIDYLGRDITSGTGFPYEFAWDPKSLNGPSVRLVLNKVKNSVREWRANEIQDTLPFYTYAIASAIKSGVLPPNPKWWQVEWLADAEDPTIDTGRDSAAEINDLKAGLTTFKRYYAARGLWWERELEQKAYEAQLIDILAKKHGISPDRIHQLAPNNTGGGATTQTDSSNQQPDGSEDK